MFKALILCTALILSTNAFAQIGGALGGNAGNQSAVDLQPAGPVKEFPWLHVGLRLSYHVTDAMYQGNLVDFHQNDNGSWTGVEHAQPSGAGAGITQITVASATDAKVADVIESYLIDSVSRHTIFEGTNGVTGNPNESTLGGSWMRRDQLDSFLQNPPAHVTVSRIPWKFGQRNCTAEVIRNEDVNIYSVCVYDLVSGLLLHKGSRLRGSGTASQPLTDPTKINVDTGYVSLHTEDLLAARDVKTPWANEPAPDWVAKTRVLHLQGTYMIHSPPGLPQPPGARLQCDLELSERGEGFVGVTQNMRMEGTNPSQQKLVWADAVIGSGYIGPQALAKLRQGAVIDDDPLTGMKTTVTKADGQVVIISQANGVSEQSSQYDRTTGMLTAVHASMATLHSEVFMQLTGHE